MAPITEAVTSTLVRLQAHAIHAQASLPTAAWDLKSFLDNARSYAQTIGGALLMLLGVSGLIWGGVLLVKKLMGGQQHGQQHGWGQIVMLILIGGALGTGGWQLISTVGSGGQTTIEELGGGTAIVQHWDGPNGSESGF